MIEQTPNRILKIDLPIPDVNSLDDLDKFLNNGSYFVLVKVGNILRVLRFLPKSRSTIYVVPAIAISVRIVHDGTEEMCSVHIVENLESLLQVYFRVDFDKFKKNIVVRNILDGSRTPPYQSIWDYYLWFGTNGLFDDNCVYTGSELLIELIAKPVKSLEALDRFYTRFRDEQHVMNTLVDQLFIQARRFYVKDSEIPEIHAPIMPMINSSGCGKTRSMLQLKSHVPGLYMTLPCESASGCPKPRPEVLAWMDEFMPSATLKKKEITLADVLEDQEHEIMFKKFFLALERRVYCTYHAVINGKSKYLNAADKRRLSVFDQFMKEWNAEGFAYDQNSALGSLFEVYKAIHVTDDEVDRARERWNAIFDSEEKIFVLCIDEASGLIERFGKLSDQTPQDDMDGTQFGYRQIVLYRTLRRAIISLRLPNLMILLASTASQLSDFTSGSTSAASLPIPAFCYLAYFDITTISDDRNLIDQLLYPNFRFLFSLGRPTYFAWLAPGPNQRPVTDVFKMADRKFYKDLRSLKSRKIPYEVWDTISAQLFGKQVNFSVNVSSDLVTKGIGVCVFISSCGKYMQAVFPSEPVNAEVAAQFLWTENEDTVTNSQTSETEIILHTNFKGLTSFWLNNYTGRYADTGEVGELVARFILLMSLQHGLKDLNHEYKFSYSLSLLDFLVNLIGDQYRNLFDGWPDKLKNSRVAFNHYLLVQEHSFKLVEECLKRRAAIICPKNYEGIDLIIPLCFDPKFDTKNSKVVDIGISHPQDGESIAYEPPAQGGRTDRSDRSKSDPEAKYRHISVLLVQIKNASGVKKYTKCISTKLSPAVALKRTDMKSIDIYASLYINFGCTNPQPPSLVPDWPHHLVINGIESGTFPSIPHSIVEDLMRFLNFYRGYHNTDIDKSIIDQFKGWTARLFPLAVMGATMRGLVERAKKTISTRGRQRRLASDMHEHPSQSARAARLAGRRTRGS